MQPTGKAKGKGKEPPKATPIHPAVAALQDELALCESQLKLKQTAADVAERRVKAEEAQLKRLEAVGVGISASDIAMQKAALDQAKVEAQMRAAELAELTIKVRVTKRKLESAETNPAALGGPTPTEQALTKLVQLLADRNKAEKDWMTKETARHAAEAALWKEQRAKEEARYAKEIEQQKELRAKEAKDAEARAKAAEQRFQEAQKHAEARQLEAEERAKAEMKRRMDAEAERQLQEKREVLKRLPGELADVELRLRAAELKREQVKLELDAAAREIDRVKANKAHLTDLKARLEKELKPTGDK